MKSFEILGCSQSYSHLCFPAFVPSDKLKQSGNLGWHLPKLCASSSGCGCPGDHSTCSSSSKNKNEHFSFSPAENSPCHQSPQTSSSKPPVSSPSSLLSLLLFKINLQQLLFLTTGSVLSESLLPEQSAVQTQKRAIVGG